jgi:hypothetical protein
LASPSATGYGGHGEIRLSVLDYGLISRVFTTHQGDDKEGPRLAALRRDFSAGNVVVSVARAQTSDGSVRQRRRLTVAPVEDDGGHGNHI